MARVRDAIGLDIGSSGVRAAQVGLAKRPATLDAFGQVPLPSTTVRDGEIQDPGMVAQAISHLWREARFKGKRVTVGVANQKVIVRPVPLPFMEEQELRGSLQFQVQEFIPLPIEEAILDFQIIDEFVNEQNERMMNVLLVAAQKDMVSDFLATVQRAGLDPVAVDLISFALVRSLGEPGGAFGGPGMGEAVIDIGASVTNIVVHERGIPRFVRTLLIGGNTLTEALAAGLGVSFEDAESIKRRMGLTPTPGEAAATGEAAPRILEERSAAFVDEVRGSINYYMAQAEATRINRVVLSGGGSKLANLPSRIANALRLPVEQGRVLQRVRMGKIGLSETQLVEAEPLMSAAIGLAMGAAEE